jgi:uncharacterized protein (TIGR00369 family)
MSDTEIPAGFARHFRQSPLTEPWEPLFSRREGGSIYLGLRVRRAHCNGRGFLHGGLVSALADNAMGLSVIETMSQQQAERDRNGLTVTLSLDYLGSAEIGRWVEFRPRVLRIGGNLGFVDCLVVADEEPIARGNATFRIYRRQKSDAS